MGDLAWRSPLESGGDIRCGGSPVLVVSRHYAPEPTGSAPVIQQMAEWLAARGRQVSVLTARPSYPERRITPGYAAGERDRTIENRVAVRRLATSVARNSGLLARLGPELRFLFDLTAQRLLGRTRRADVVISLCPSIFTTLGACLLVRRHGRHVAIVHDIASGLGVALGMGAGSPATRLLRWLEAATLNRADAIVTLSEGMARALTELGIRRPITILPPQVSTRQIVPLPRPSGAPRTLMYSGNLGRKQGLGQLLDMAAVLKRRAPDVRIVVRGEGAGRSALADRIDSEGLDNVDLLPLAPVGQIAAALAEGDVHLVPQLPEGSDFAVPSKVFAIMAAGRPLVATAASGSALERLAGQSDAICCVPPNAPEAFADAALSLLEDAPRRERMGVAGRHYAEHHADTNVVMRQLVALLEHPPC